MTIDLLSHRFYKDLAISDSSVTTRRLSLVAAKLVVAYLIIPYAFAIVSYELLVLRVFIS